MFSTPAAHLHALLEKARDYPGLDESITSDAWSQILSSQSASMNVPQMLAGVCSLIKNIEALVEFDNKIKDTARKIYRGALATVISAFDFKYSKQKWSWTKSNFLSASTLQVIALLDNDMSGRIEDRIISKDELADIKAELLEMFERVKKSDVNHLLRIMVMSQISAIIDCVAHYDIYGTSGLREKFSTAVGSVITHIDLYTNVDRDKEPAVFEFNGFLDRWVTRVRTVINGAEAIEAGYNVVQRLTAASN